MTQTKSFEIDQGTDFMASFHVLNGLTNENIDLTDFFVSAKLLKPDNTKVEFSTAITINKVSIILTSAQTGALDPGVLYPYNVILTDPESKKHKILAGNVLIVSTII
jgi:hypothetical protein